MQDTWDEIARQYETQDLVEEINCEMSTAFDALTATSDVGNKCGDLTNSVRVDTRVAEEASQVIDDTFESYEMPFERDTVMAATAEMEYRGLCVSWGDGGITEPFPPTEAQYQSFEDVRGSMVLIREDIYDEIEPRFFAPLVRHELAHRVEYEMFGNNLSGENGVRFRAICRKLDAIHGQPINEISNEYLGLD